MPGEELQKEPIYVKWSLLGGHLMKMAPQLHFINYLAPGWHPFNAQRSFSKYAKIIISLYFLQCYVALWTCALVPLSLNHIACLRNFTLRLCHSNNTDLYVSEKVILKKSHKEQQLIVWGVILSVLQTSIHPSIISSLPRAGQQAKQSISKLPSPQEHFPASPWGSLTHSQARWEFYRHMIYSGHLWENAFWATQDFSVAEL